MSKARSAVLGSIAALVAAAAIAGAQQSAAQQPAAQQPAAPSGPHTIVINLIEQPGPKPFAFSPAAFTARQGDTLRFVQAANTMHNVHFKSEPSGAKLGGAAISPYLTTKGQAYTLVVDSRFTDGTYQIVCDPHEMIGMHATLTVLGPTTVAANKR
ncbi:MAG TPA: plastocyanin/azurin family copper-binding protein [Gemmatimonadaceae bacterium]|nr:plastocyanin/azurin family copper-binding protein [Gemmatimonadaceae bacterium]